jgi:hypothetical protein
MSDMTDAVPAPSRLWKQMTPEQRLRAALAFWKDEASGEDQIQAVLLIAQRKKFRPKSVVALDDERKARHLAGLSPMPESIAARALVAYHLDGQRPMMGAFLDALGIRHENGLIQDHEGAPDRASIAAAAADLAQRFPADDVALYLNTLLSQDPETWGGLREVLQGGAGD